MSRAGAADEAERVRNGCVDLVWDERVTLTVDAPWKLERARRGRLDVEEVEKGALRARLSDGRARRRELRADGSVGWFEDDESGWSRRVCRGR